MNRFARVTLCCFTLTTVWAVPVPAQNAQVKERANDGTEVKEVKQVTEVKSDSGTTPESNQAVKKLDMPVKEAEYKEPSAYPRRPKLLATINHNEHFPPLPEDLRPGNTFDEKKVPPADDGDNHWYQIPKWIAGTYGYTDMVNYEERDFETGKVSTKRLQLGSTSEGRTRGIMLDKAGNIWQKIYGGPVGVSAVAGKTTDMDLHKFDDGLSGQIISPTQYAESSAGVEFIVNKKTQKIEFVSRWERIREFELKPTGVVEVDVSEKTFDSDGKPIFSYRMSGHMKKLADFRPLTPGLKSTYAGDYSQATADLKSYMEKTGRGADAPELVNQ